MKKERVAINRITKIIVYFFVCMSAQPSLGISLVYNLKIRRAFVLGIGGFLSHKPRWVGAAVPILYRRSRHITDEARAIDVGDKRRTVGSLLNIRYIPSKQWWVEGSTGIENEKVTLTGTTKLKDSRAGFDDIVISGGRNFFIGDRAQFVAYLIAGFPTRRKVAAVEQFDTLIGTRFFALGAGSELSYAFVNRLEKSFIGIFQNRFIHFFDRSWYPILPCGAKIQPGNVTDLLFSLQYRRMRNIVEVGFNPTFFSNQGVMLASGTTETPWFVRYGVYASFAHVCKRFPLVSKQTIVGFGGNITRSSRFNTKIGIVWGTFAIVF